MVELLKQPQYQPFHVNQQVISIFAGANGFLDDLPATSVAAFETALIKHVYDEYPELVQKIDETKDLPNDAAEKLREIIRAFKSHFKA
jgi:F-type H+-transporting ATPase subunit alpha